MTTRHTFCILTVALALTACADPAPSGTADSSGSDDGSDGDATTVADDGSDDDGTSGGSSDGGDESSSTGDAPGSPDAFEPFARSGTRLQHRGYVVDDVGRYLETRDLELDAACQIELASDDTWRCMPDDREHAIEFHTDADCSAGSRVYLYDGPCTAPRWARRSVADEETCGSSRSEAIALTAMPFDEPVTLYYTEGDSCLAWGEADPANAQLFEGTSIDPAELVQLELVIEVNADGLGVRVFEGVDGSRLVTGLYDERYGAGWHRELVDLEGTRLIPESFAYATGSVWGDAACTEYVGLSWQCDEPELLLSAEQGDGSMMRAFHVGDEIDPSAAYGGDACELGGAGFVEGYRLFRAGDPVDDDELATLALEEVGPGPTRLRTLALPTGERVAIADDAWSHEGEPCFAVPRTDGGAWCLPVRSHSASFGWFADAACSEPLAGLSIDLAAPAGTLVYDIAYDGCGIDATLSRVAEVVAEHVGPHYYGDELSGTCMLLDPPADVAYYAVSDVERATLPVLDAAAL
jgi:hypothetical protein